MIKCPRADDIIIVLMLYFLLLCSHPPSISIQQVQLPQAALLLIVFISNCGNISHDKNLSTTRCQCRGGPRVQSWGNHKKYLPIITTRANHLGIVAPRSDFCGLYRHSNHLSERDLTGRGRQFRIRTKSSQYCAG